MLSRCRKLVKQGTLRNAASALCSISSPIPATENHKDSFLGFHPAPTQTADHLSQRHVLPYLLVFTETKVRRQLPVLPHQSPRGPDGLRQIFFSAFSNEQSGTNSDPLAILELTKFVNTAVDV